MVKLKWPEWPSAKMEKELRAQLRAQERRVRELEYENLQLTNMILERSGHRGVEMLGPDKEPEAKGPIAVPYMDFRRRNS